MVVSFGLMHKDARVVRSVLGTRLKAHNHMRSMIFSKSLFRYRNDSMKC